MIKTVPDTFFSPRVLVTGIGLQTCLGDDRETSWRKLCAGDGGGRFLDQPFDPGSPEDAGFSLAYSDHRPSEILTRAGIQATSDAGLTRHEPPVDRRRVGCVIGMSKGDLRRLSLYKAALAEGKDRALDEPGWLGVWPNAGAAIASSVIDLRGPCLAPVAACATGLIAALQGADLIRRGLCDLVLVGAGDSSLEPLLLGAFRRMGVLARVGEGNAPQRAVRPWDRDRSGFLVGEGAAVLVLERADHARARGALPYAEFCGGAFGADAYHETNLNPDPANLAGLIGRALANAGVDPSEVDHVNVHGTATKVNDPLECQAIRRAFGRSADGLSCSANKAQVGHTLGAAGAVELAFTALAVRDGFVPPTLNLDRPDPLCDLDGTPHVGRSRPIRAALKLSIGFGGHLAAALLRRPDGPRREPDGP